jgi:hypothetical protein
MLGYGLNKRAENVRLSDAKQQAQLDPVPALAGWPAGGMNHVFGV